MSQENSECPKVTWKVIYLKIFAINRIVENEKVDFNSGNTNLTLSVLESNYKSRKMFYNNTRKFTSEGTGGKRLFS
jgi:hypothetical protein